MNGSPHNHTAAYSSMEMMHDYEHQCKLLAGPVAWSAQIVLFTAVSATLIYKWVSENPRRPYRTWLLDVSKQGFSTAAAHFCGMSIAIITSNQAHNASQCAWYFVVFLTDTTLGVSVAILLHSTIVTLARRAQRRRHAAQAVLAQQSPPVALPSKWWEAMCEPGTYGSPVQMNRWALQMITWVLCTVSGRVVCGIIIVSSRDVLEGLPMALDHQFGGNGQAQLFFVMVTCPLIMNALQAYIQDHILKFKRTAEPARGSQGGAGPAPGGAAAAAADAADAGGKDAGGKPGDSSKQVIVVTMEAA